MKRAILKKADHSASKNVKDYIGVIGGGIAGVTTALGLADEGYKVVLFEATSTLLDKTSDATPCRLGVGFHYMDEQTALTGLETTIELIRYLRQTTGHSFQVLDKETKDGFTRTKKVVYAISVDSLVKRSEILRIFESLKTRYAALVKLDPENQVLGPIASFYKAVDKKKYRGKLNINALSMVIETCETLFDWPLFKTYLVGRIYTNLNITVLVNAKVKAINKKSDFCSEVVLDDKHSYPFRFVVNSAWNDVDRLNSTAGYESGLDTVNRVKCMAVLRLPKTMLSESFMVGYGPFCSLSSRPDGLGYLTYEPVTNVAQFDSKRQAGKEAQCIAEVMQLHKQRELGEAIIQGALNYISGIEGCELIGIKSGVVRTDHGTIDIHTVGSHFKRTFKGVYAASLGLIVNESRKHTYWCVNMHRTLRLIECQKYLQENLPTFLYFLSLSIRSRNSKVILAALMHNLLPSLLSKDRVELLEEKLIDELKFRPLFFKLKYQLHRELLSKHAAAITLQSRL